MYSKEYQNISKAIEVALGFQKQDRNVFNIKKQKQNGSLDYKFKKFVKPDFIIILKEFIEIMEEPTLEKKPVYRKVLAYKDNDFIRLFDSYGYEISSWLNKDKELNPENNRAFINFPLFFKESCRKCSINRYATKTVEELEVLLSKYIDIKHTESLRPRKDRKNIEEEVLAVMHTESPKPNQYNIKAEEYSYRSLLSNTRPVQVIRVSKEVGSGFGFDILQVDDDIETLVTTKASDNMESFKLSKREYEVMEETSKYRNTRYYIDKYLFTKEGSVRLKTRYVYDKYNEVLVDVEDESNICNIARQDYVTKNGVQKTRYVCTPVKFKFVKDEPKIYKYTLDQKEDSNN